MINFDKVTLSDVVPGFLKNEKEIKALSYALKTQTDKLLEQTYELDYWVDIDNCSEMILNALGFELAIPSWNLNLAREQKIELIKSAIVGKMKMGTPQIVESFLSTILGETTKIKEWFEFGGETGTFKIITSKSDTSDSEIESVKNIAKKVSRLSQHISAVDIHFKSQCDLKVAAIVRSGTKITLRCDERS